MNETQVIRVALLLSYIFLVTGGKDARTTNQQENTSQIIVDRHFNKTITMEDGDVYDCIDANHQPAFNHPLLKYHKFQMEPSSFPIGLNTKSSFLHVFAQAHLPTVDCPTGMVPILRTSKRDQNTLHNIHQVRNEAMQQEEAGIKYFDDLYGVRATINVYEPKVNKDSEDLSQTGIQIDNGPKDQIDSIVVCYSVAPGLGGDRFARFHIVWNDGVRNMSCVDLDCPGFVQVSHNVGLGGRIRPVSVYNGPQYVINILVFKDPKTNNWWLAYGEENTLIGYWPSSLFNRFKDKGDFSFWGGNVYGPTASLHSPQIGSGHFASEGYGKAAFMRKIQIVDENNKLVTPNKNKDLVGTSDLLKYSVDGYEVDKHGMHMYYGGPGNLV